MADDEGDNMSDTTDAKVADAAKATTEERTKKELVVMIIQSFGLALGFFIALGSGDMNPTEVPKIDPGYNN